MKWQYCPLTHRTMRKPLAPLQAFAEDARLAAERGSDVRDELVEWLAVAQAVEFLASAPAQEREAQLPEVRRTLAKFVGRRPVIVHDVLSAPTAPLDVLIEEIRVAAEAMEVGGCFELALSVVSSACRLSAGGNYVSTMLATTHLGRVARQMNELSFADDCYTNVINTCARERDGPLEARGHIGLALLHDMRGNLPACEAEYRRVLAIAAPNKACAIGAWQGLMSIAMTRGDLGDALQYGWRIYDASDDNPDGKIAALSDLSIVSTQAGFPRPALNGFRQALSLCTVERHRLPVLGGAIRAAAALGERELAATFDRQALKGIARANQPYTATMTLLNLADGWITLREFDTAARRVEAAREIAEQFRYAEYIFRADVLSDRIHHERRQSDAQPSSMPRALNTSAEPTVDNVSVSDGLRRLATVRA